MEPGRCTGCHASLDRLRLTFSAWITDGRLDLSFAWTFFGTSHRHGWRIEVNMQFDPIRITFSRLHLYLDPCSNALHWQDSSAGQLSPKQIASAYDRVQTPASPQMLPVPRRTHRCIRLPHPTISQPASFPRHSSPKETTSFLVAAFIPRSPRRYR